MSRDPTVLLRHIRLCLDRIADYAKGGQAEFMADPKTQDAIIRNLEVIGEAARRFDEAFRLAHPEIPWREMTDVRNILIHAYDRVAAEILVDIVRRDIPPLLASVNSLLGQDSF